MSRRDWTCLGLAVAAGAFATYVDTNSAEVQPTVLSLLVMGVLLGFAQPKRWWLWGLVTGATLPLAYGGAALAGVSLRWWPQPNVGASALAIVPSMIAAGFGAFVAK
jgi:hypothetical protein